MPELSACLSMALIQDSYHSPIPRHPWRIDAGVIICEIRHGNAKIEYKNYEIELASSEKETLKFYGIGNKK